MFAQNPKVGVFGLILLCTVKIPFVRSHRICDGFSAIVFLDGLAVEGADEVEPQCFWEGRLGQIFPKNALYVSPFEAAVPFLATNHPHGFWSLAPRKRECGSERVEC